MRHRLTRSAPAVPDRAAPRPTHRFAGCVRAWRFRLQAGEDVTVRYPRRDDPELMAAIQRYVITGSSVRPGRYWALGGRVLALSGTERAEFGLALGRDAWQITDRELSTLLDSEWRSRITAAWLIGLDRRTQFRARLGELLLNSELVYAGQGYCLALARFGTAADAAILSSYLDKYLPRADCFYDQHWAIGALLHLDSRLGSSRASRFLEPGGPWDKSAMRGQDPAEWHRHIDSLCAFADHCMSASRDHAELPDRSR
jgi:hypothetical protein